MDVIYIVTGGAGRLGNHIIEHLSKKAHVVNIDLNTNMLACKNFKYDLSRENDFSNLMSYLEKFDSLNEVRFIHAAGIVGDVSKNDWVTDLNSIGESISKSCFFLSAMAPSKLIANFQERYYVRAVFVQSIYATISPDFSIYSDSERLQNPIAYGASKAASLYVMNWLNSYYKQRVCINSISPGGIESENMPDDFKIKYLDKTRNREFTNTNQILTTIDYFLNSNIRQVVNENIMIADGFS